MTQGELGFWKSGDFLTYTELTEYRTRAYSRKGPRLIRETEGCLELVEDESLGLDALAELNEISKLLGALNPDWSEFSVEVFKAYLAPTQNTGKQLRCSFETTMRRLRGKEIAKAA